MSRVQVIIGLGSNLDNPVQQIRQAINSLKQLQHGQLLAVSPIYKSKAMLAEGADQQPDYINAVALLETGLSARQLLAACQQLENQQGRVRQQRWGPRTLDLDILTYGDECINETDLAIPHPGITQRNFVLFPLQDMMGEDFIIPGQGKLSELVKSCSADGLQKLTEKTE